MIKLRSRENLPGVLRRARADEEVRDGVREAERAQRLTDTHPNRRVRALLPRLELATSGRGVVCGEHQRASRVRRDAAPEKIEAGAALKQLHFQRVSTVLKHEAKEIRVLEHGKNKSLKLSN